MFLSNNSSSCSNITVHHHQQQQQQQPMLDKSLFCINDVSPNINSFKQYHHHPNSPPHDLQPSFFHFSPTFVDHICYEDDVGFFQQQHQDLLLSSNSSCHQFISQHQQPLLLTTLNDTSTTTDNTPSQTLPESAINNVPVALKTEKSKMIINNNTDAGGVSAHFKTNNNKKNSWNNKRCSLPPTKKDRHRKIVTAQGPRDRRMRLSLKVAHPFFTLQEMLGFDKASKTVEWLLMNCKLEINELKRSRLLASEATATTKLSGSGGSYISGCEVLSEIDTTTEVQEQGNGNKQKEKRVRGTRKPPTFHPLAKETRAKARARARERTIGKMWSRSLPTMQYHPQGNNHLPNNLNQLRAATSFFEFETGDESGSQSQDMKSSLEVVAEVEEPSSHSLEESIVINSNSSSSHQIFNCQQEIESSQGLNLNNTNNSSSFAENWDMDDASANSSFCATSTNINHHLSTGNVNDPISSPFRLTTSSDASLPSQFIDFQFFE